MGLFGTMNQEIAQKMWEEAVEVIPASECTLLVATPKARPARSSASGREVRLLTIGWKVEMENKNRHFVELEEEWLIQLNLDDAKMSQERINCVRRFAKSEKLNPTVILNATNLFVTDENDKEHVETNPTIMVKATSSPHFMPWIEDAKENIQKAMKRTTGEADILITCETGTRRSVAAAALLKPILEKIEGYDVLEV